MSKYKIGSARSDENFKLSGGKPGDQRQKALIDGAGEVSIQDFYVHKKGWLIAVAKDAKIRKALAEKMVTACCNKNIGYSQTGRYGITKFGINTKTPCNADCSSLVRQCVKEASGKDPGDFNTASEIAALRTTGLFDFDEYHDGMKLMTGTILVTKTKGHTAIVTEGESEKVAKSTKTEKALKTEKAASKSKYYPKYEGATLSLIDALQAVGETDTAMKHRKAIAAANNIEKYTGTVAQNNKLLQLLKAGKLIRA